MKSFLILLIYILSFSRASHASGSDCSLQIITSKKSNLSIPFDVNNPFVVYIGNSYQARFNSSLKALKLINFLQENNYCQQEISSEIPKCRTEFLPSDRLELAMYTVRAGEQLIDTVGLDVKNNQQNIKLTKIKAQSKAQNIVDLLKQIRFCQ